MLTIIYFVFILGVTVFIHELGHFLFAKKFGVYVYEFSIGMGPRLFKFNRKNDETDYCIRLFPIGGCGYVQMAGEEVEVDEKIPVEKRLQSKKWYQRLLIMVAGVMNNFILAIVVLFIVALFNGVRLDSRFVTNSTISGLKDGDKIVSINNRFVNNYDKLALELTVVGKKDFKMKVMHKDGNYQTVKVSPKAVYDEKEELLGYDYGFELTGKHEHNLLVSIRYAFRKFFSLIEQMIFTVLYLFTGDLSIKLLSGPVGIFNVVGTASSAGFMMILSLLALISVNVGFINLLPIPAFDGGHVLFIIIEKIKGSPVNQKIENTIHTVFLVLLMILMLYITFNDILKLF